MKKTLIGLSLFFVLASALASAKSYGGTYYKTGAYIGGSFGRTELDVSAADQSSLAEQGVTFDDTDTGFKLFGGYRIDQIAVEVFYADLGETSFGSGSTKGNTEADSIGGSILVIFPVSNRFDLFGKVGVHAWDSDFSSNVGVSDSDDGTDPMFGIGAAYNINQVSFSAEYERYELDNVDIDLMSLGVAYRF